MGNVMVLKPFETSLSIVYKGKGEVKVRGDVKAEHSKFQTTGWGWFNHALLPHLKRWMTVSTNSNCCDSLKSSS